VKFILPDVDEFAQQFLAIPCNIRDRRLRPDDLSETIDKARKIAVSMKFDPLVSASCRRFRRWRHLRRCRFDRRPKCDGNSRAGEETGMKSLILADVATAVVTATAAAVRREWQR